jgi:anaphase-promoting complex subunit 1
VYDLELPGNVTTSALCSLGFLFMGSGNRNFTEVALGLIGRKPINDKVTDREGYSLAAGIALGLINLSKGNVWKRELQIEDRLIRFIQGGKVMSPPESTLSTTF